MAKAEKQAETGGTIKIQYYRSSIGYSKNQKQIVRSIGLTKLNQIVERPDTPSMRGVVAKVPHLLRIVD
jgi:large subunit ribosomal protein L30